jgi:adenylate cyclase, class 1
MRHLDTSISSGLRAFTKYNRYKKDIMRKCDPAGARVILELLPLLIHINHPSLPGYIEQEDCPCGIKYMEWPSQTLREIGSYLTSRIKLGRMQEYMPRQLEIEGLFTIGSVGSLAQTRESDYDIWVVVDAKRIEKDRLRILDKKLKNLQRWITSRYVLDIHFFLMDLEDIMANNFGSISQEGSGSALKSILKEEFYRTLTLIEGRVPLWWVVPPEKDKDTYDKMRTIVQPQSNSTDEHIIDLGDVASIPEQELLGAALWQMHKALDDPLKSVLKMALVASYLDPSMKDILLCNILKNNVFYASGNEIVDPYYQILRRVEDFYSIQGDHRTIDLLRKCFYLKVNPNIRSVDLLKLERDDKSTIMVDIVKSWGWSLNIIKELNEFSEWDVEKYRKFGDDIHAYLKLATVQLIRRAKSYMVVHSSLEEDIEVEVLRRRVEAYYVSKDGKVESEKRVKKKEPAYRDLFFAYKNGIWSIYERSPDMSKNAPIMESERVTKILAWLVYNRRFDASTAFHMIPNPSKVVLSDIQSLLWRLNTLIPDASSIGLDRSSLMEDKYAKHVVIVANIECPDSLHSIREVDVLYMNTWNELFCISLKPEQMSAWMARMKKTSTQVNIWLPKDGNPKYLTQVVVSLIH